MRYWYAARKKSALYYSPVTAELELCHTDAIRVRKKQNICAFSPISFDRSKDTDAESYKFSRGSGSRVAQSCTELHRLTHSYTSE